MASFSSEVTFLLAGIAGVAVLATLGTLASLIRNSTAVHDLQVSAAALRISYAKQMAAVEGVEIVEVDEPAPEQPTLPAP